MELKAQIMMYTTHTALKMKEKLVPAVTDDKHEIATKRVRTFLCIFELFSLSFNFNFVNVLKRQLHT